MPLVRQELGDEHTALFDKLDQELDVMHADDIAFMQAMREALGQSLADEKKSFLIGKAA